MPVRTLSGSLVTPWRRVVSTPSSDGRLPKHRPQEPRDHFLTFERRRRRHRARMLLWLRHAVSDDIGDALEAAIAPQPRSTSQISAHWGADAVSSVTSGAGRTGNLAMEDLLTEGNLFARGAGRTASQLTARPRRDERPRAAERRARLGLRLPELEQPQFPSHWDRRHKSRARCGRPCRR